MGSMTTGRWILGAVLTLGCQAESPVVGESPPEVEADTESEPAGTATVVLERVAGDSCIPYDLSYDELTENVPCLVLETLLDPAPDACSCAPELARGTVDPDVVDLVRRELENAGECNAGAGTPACDALCMCEILQASGSTLQACQNEPEHSDTQGFCIVDPAQDQGNPDLVSGCPLSSKKLLRLGIAEAPSDTALHLLCLPQVRGHEEVQDLGAPCTPSVERDPSFPGFTLGSVSVEMQAPGCASDVCLVHNFQGRVSCPYGQTEDEALNSPACFASGTPVPVQTDVAPQLQARPPELASICSCRCDGPNVAEPYCECPESMECAPLFPDVGLGAGGPGGSYCVPRGSLIADTGQSGPTCDAAEENCGSAR